MYASPRSYLALTVWILAVLVLPVIRALLVSPLSLPRGPSLVLGSDGAHCWQNSPRSPCQSRLCILHMKSARSSRSSKSVITDESTSSSGSSDPFQLLNLGPCADQREIKRAYKQMALKYHPDVVTNKDATPEQKKRANDVFAKINGAYAHLSAKDGATSSTFSTTSSHTSSSTTSTSTKSSSSSSPCPPHHHHHHRPTSRPHDFNPNTNQASTDRRDYVPKYEKEKQASNAGVDNDFDKKLEDLFNGAAAADGGRGDIFRDFDNFLLVNGDGHSFGEEEDNAQLQTLLKRGSVEQVGMQMEEQELVVQQLEGKRNHLANEVRQANREIASTNLYLEKKEWAKEVADLEARKRLVDGDLDEARKRLSALQARHEQLVMIGEIHGYARGHRRSASRSTSSPYSTTNSSSTRGTTNNASPASSSSSTPPPPQQESPVTPPPRRQTSTPRPQSSTTTRRGTYSNGSTASSFSCCSSSSTSISEEDAWIHEEFGSNYRGQGRDTRSTASSSQRQPYSLYTPPPPRQESSATGGTYRNGSAFHHGKIPYTREQPLENDGGQTADICWKVRMRDTVTGDNTLSLAEREILKAATWVFEFSLRQRAHCIASRMLDENLQNPDRDESSPPVPNPENPAEAVALKLVEFAPSGERKPKQTISTGTAEQQVGEQSRTFLNNTPLGKSADVKGKGGTGSFVSNFTQSVSTRTAEQQTDDERKPVIDYVKAEASSLQTRHGKLDEGWMGKLAGYTDVEGIPRSLHLLHEKTKKEEQDKARSAERGADPLSMSRASNRKKRVATTKKEKKKAKKRAEWLTRHICVLEAHKTKFPSGYYKAENAKGNVLGSLCSVFSVPAKKVDGTTTNKAADKRLAIQKELGEENPKRVFNDTLEDLKQQLVSEVVRSIVIDDGEML